MNAQWIRVLAQLYRRGCGGTHLWSQPWKRESLGSRVPDQPQLHKLKPSLLEDMRPWLKVFPVLILYLDLGPISKKYICMCVYIHICTYICKYSKI